MSAIDNPNTEKESIAKEVGSAVASGDGGTLAKTFFAYAFDRQKIVDAILAQEWKDLTKPVKYHLAMFGILAASMALFGKPEPDPDIGKLGKLIDMLRPYLMLIAITWPYSILMHFFLGSHGRRMSDTIRVICYSTGTFFIVGAALAPFMENTQQWPLYIILPFAIYLLIIRPYQIIHLSHGVGFGRYFIAMMFSNIVAIVPAFLIFSAFLFLLGVLGLLPPSQ